MKRTQLTSGLAIIALSLGTTVWAAESSSSSQTKQPMNAQQSGSPMQGSLHRSDQQFLQTAASTNSAEIQMSKIAEQNSSDPRIRSLAKDLQKDHAKANQELQRLAASKGLTLSFQPTASQQKEIQALSQKRGDEFNRLFLSRNVKGHEQTIALFQKEGQRAQDPDVKSWANKMLPDLHSHLAMVQQISPQAVGEKTRQQQTTPQMQKESTKKHHRSESRSSSY